MSYESRESMLVDYDRPYGFIYIVKNAELPNWVKLGRTNNVDRRVAELNTGAPEPFVLCKAWVTNDEVHAERVCHAALADVRARTGREFYRVHTGPQIQTLEEFESRDHPVEQLVEFLDQLMAASGIRADDAWHPQLMG